MFKRRLRPSTAGPRRPAHPAIPNDYNEGDGGSVNLEIKTSQSNLKRPTSSHSNKGPSHLEKRKANRPQSAYVKLAERTDASRQFKQQVDTEASNPCLWTMGSAQKQRQSYKDILKQKISSSNKNTSTVINLGSFMGPEPAVQPQLNHLSSKNDIFKAFHPSQDFKFCERLHKFAMQQQKQVESRGLSSKKSLPGKQPERSIFKKATDNSSDETNPDLNYVFDPKDIADIEDQEAENYSVTQSAQESTKFHLRQLFKTCSNIDDVYDIVFDQLCREKSIRETLPEDKKRALVLSFFKHNPDLLIEATRNVNSRQDDQLTNKFTASSSEIFSNQVIQQRKFDQKTKPQFYSSSMRYTNLLGSTSQKRVKAATRSIRAVGEQGRGSTPSRNSLKASRYSQNGTEQTQKMKAAYSTSQADLKVIFNGPFESRRVSNESGKKGRGASGPTSKFNQKKVPVFSSSPNIKRLLQGYELEEDLKKLRKKNIKRGGLFHHIGQTSSRTNFTQAQAANRSKMIQGDSITAISCGDQPTLTSAGRYQQYAEEPQVNAPTSLIDIPEEEGPSPSKAPDLNKQSTFDLSENSKTRYLAKNPYQSFRQKAEKKQSRVRPCSAKVPSLSQACSRQFASQHVNSQLTTKEEELPLENKSLKSQDIKINLRSQLSQEALGEQQNLKRSLGKAASRGTLSQYITSSIAPPETASQMRKVSKERARANKIKAEQMRRTSPYNQPCQSQALLRTRTKQPSALHSKVEVLRRSATQKEVRKSKRKPLFITNMNPASLNYVASFSQLQQNRRSEEYSEGRNLIHIGSKPQGSRTYNQSMSEAQLEQPIFTEDQMAKPAVDEQQQLEELDPEPIDPRDALQANEEEYVDYPHYPFYQGVPQQTNQHDFQTGYFPDSDATHSPPIEPHAPIQEVSYENDRYAMYEPMQSPEQEAKLIVHRPRLMVKPGRALKQSKGPIPNGLNRIKNMQRAQRKSYGKIKEQDSWKGEEIEEEYILASSGNVDGLHKMQRKRPVLREFLR